jgi:hypothetical protein
MKSAANVSQQLRKMDRVRLVKTAPQTLVELLTHIEEGGGND